MTRGCFPHSSGYRRTIPASRAALVQLSSPPTPDVDALRCRESGLVSVQPVKPQRSSTQLGLILLGIAAFELITDLLWLIARIGAPPTMLSVAAGAVFDAAGRSPHRTRLRIRDRCAPAEKPLSLATSARSPTSEPSRDKRCTAPRAYVSAGRMRNGQWNGSGPLGSAPLRHSDSRARIVVSNV
jgi:hypothetical protein